MATASGLPQSHLGPGRAGPTPGMQWLTPRGQDVSGVFKLLQRPTVRSVKHAAFTEESHQDLLVTLMTEGGNVAEDGRTLVADPLALLWVRVYASQHPRQGFVRLLKADRPTPSECVGSHAYFRMLIPGTLVSDYIKIEIAADPTRMMRIGLIAFSQAPSATTRQRAHTAPHQTADDTFDEGNDNEVSADGDGDHPMSTATDDTPQRPQQERSVLVDLSPPPPTLAQLPHPLEENEEVVSPRSSAALQRWAMRNNASPAVDGGRRIVTTQEVADGEQSNAALGHHQRPHPSRQLPSIDPIAPPVKTVVVPSSYRPIHVPPTSSQQENVIAEPQATSDSQHTRQLSPEDAHNRSASGRSLRDVIVEYTKRRFLEGASDLQMDSRQHDIHNSHNRSTSPKVANTSASRTTYGGGMDVASALDRSQRSHSVSTHATHIAPGGGGVIGTPPMRLDDEALLHHVMQGFKRGVEQRTNVPMCIVCTESVADALSHTIVGLPHHGGRPALVLPAGCRLAVVVYCGRGDWRRAWSTASHSHPHDPPSPSVLLKLESEGFAVFRDELATVVVCRSIADARRALTSWSNDHQWHPTRPQSQPPRNGSGSDSSALLSLRLVADDTTHTYSTAFASLDQELRAFARVSPFLLYRLVSRQQANSPSNGGTQTTMPPDGLSLSRYCRGLELAEIHGEDAPPVGVLGALRRYMVRLGQPQSLWWASARNHPSDPQRGQGIAVCVTDENPLELLHDVDGYVGNARLGAAIQGVAESAPSGHARDTAGRSRRDFVEVAGSWEDVVLTALHHARGRCWATVCIHVDPPQQSVVPSDMFDAWMDTLSLWSAAYPSCVVLTSPAGVAGFSEECVAMFSPHAPPQQQHQLPRPSSHNVSMR